MKVTDRILSNRLLWPIMGLVLLFVFNGLYGEGFFKIEIMNGYLYGTTIDIINQGSKVMLLAIGMTLVIATGGIDLSVGSIMAVSGSIGALLVNETDYSFALIVAIALVATVIIGLVNGVLVSYIGLQPFVATLIMMVTARGIALLITNGFIYTFEDEDFVFLGNGHFLMLPFTLTIVLIMTVISIFITRKTAVGVFIEAVGDNERASRFAGINTRVVKMVVYGFSGLCAGIAGLVATSNIKAADTIKLGETMEMDAIFAVVVGGTSLTGGKFNLIGSLIGALLIQTLTTTMYFLGVPPAITAVPKSIVIILVCLLQSEEFRRMIVSVVRRSRA